MPRLKLASHQCQFTAEDNQSAKFNLKDHLKGPWNTNICDSNVQSSSSNAIAQNLMVTAGTKVLPASDIQSNNNVADVKADDGDNKAVKGKKAKPQGRHICSYCGHRCAKPSVLEKHLRAHTNERPFPCIPCGFAFKTKSNLYKHCKSRAHVMNVNSSGPGGKLNTGTEISTDSLSSSSITYSDDEFSDNSCDSVRTEQSEPSPSHPSESSRNVKPSDDVRMASSIYGTKALNLMDSTLSGFVKLDFAKTAKENDINSVHNVPVNFSKSLDQVRLRTLSSISEDEPKTSKVSIPCDNSIKNNFKTKGAGLKLEIPTPEANALNSAGSSGSASSSKSQKSPKVTSPEQIGLHISKIISENAAIVETFDSLWPRRYMRQSSIGTSQNVDAELKKTDQPRSLSIKGRRFSDNLAWTTKKMSKDDDDDLDNCQEFMNSFCQTSSKENATKVINNVPENPEGSIIKDLLLKARDSPKEVASTDSNCNYIVTPVSSHLSTTTAVTSSSFNLCSNCNVSFKKRKNLEIHQLHYCNKPKLNVNMTTTPYDPQETSAESQAATIKRISYDVQDPSSNKKRKLSDTNLLHTVKSDCNRRISLAGVTNDELLKLQRSSPKRQGSLQLFGGQVEIKDAATESKKLNADTAGSVHSNSSVFPWIASQNSPLPSSASVSPSPFMVTIAKPVLNSGGTVLQVSNAQVSSKNSMCIPVVALGGPLMSSRSSSPKDSQSQIDKYDAVVLSSSNVLPVSDSETIRSASERPPSPICPFPSAASNLNSTLAVPNFVFSYNSSKDDRSDDPSMSSVKKWPGKVPEVTVTPDSPRSSPTLTIQTTAEDSQNFLAPKRPNSLPLKKKAVTMKLVGTTLVSPETPRPKKRYGQLHLNGNAYTYLGLKRSTKSTWCCIYRPQPMYVPQDTDSKLSMYSNWQAVPTDPQFHGLSAGKAMSLYDSHHLKRNSKMNICKHETTYIVTHSSYWKYKKEQENMDEEPSKSSESLCNNKQVSSDLLIIAQQDSSSLKSPRKSPIASPNPSIPKPKEACETSKPPEIINHQLQKNGNKRIKIFEGGYKSNEDYTYVRGRGRGKYVCEECGIRCKKPSMLKKHIRTHTDLRPYTCRHCSFSFKTKGNLTKHMKSKAHHKRCVELGIVPVPTFIDSSQIDTVALAKQEELDRNRRKFEEEDDDDDSEDDEDDDEDGEEDDDSDSEKIHKNGPVTLNTSFPLTVSVQSPIATEQEASKSIMHLSSVIQPSSHSTKVIKSPCPQFSSSNLSPMPMLLSPKPISPNDKLNSPLHLNVISPSTSTSVLYSPRYSESIKKNSLPSPLSRRRSISETTEDSFHDSHHKQRKYSLTYPQPVITATDLHVDKVTSEKSDQPMDLSVSAKIQPELPTESVVKPLPVSSTQTIPASVTVHQANLSTAASIANRYQEMVAAPSKKHAPPRKYSIVLPEPAPLKITEAAAPKEVNSPSNDDDDGAPLPSFSAMTSYTNSLGEEGKCMCQICHKFFSKPSQLRLHVNIHYIERPFRCESCAISFRTKGHLEKHKRSLSHFNKVNINMTFGIATTENPRPFKCSDCKIAFRIHGHLAKHLRSKLHIMKLECLGKLPFGIYAEMERSGANLNEIDTSDCNNSLESLQLIAQKICGKEMASVSQPMDTTDVSDKPSPKEPTDDSSDIIVDTEDEIQTFSNVGIKNETSTGDYVDNSDSDGSELDVTTPTPWSCSQCQIIFKSAKLLEVHMSDVHRSEHQNNPAVVMATIYPPKETSVTFCSICHKKCSSNEEFQQHLLTHAQPRPFVCEICDAGFISMHHLNYHMTSFHQAVSCQTCGLTFANTSVLHQHVQEAHMTRKTYL